jgi:hypothetical protein
MFSALMIIAALGVQDTDIILRERPLPLVETGARTALCGRVEVSIEYENSWEKGVLKLDGKASYARSGKSLAPVLNDIRRRSGNINDVRISCEDENVVRVTINAAGVDGGDYRWVLIVNAKLDVSIEEIVEPRGGDERADR